MAGRRDMRNSDVGCDEMEVASQASRGGLHPCDRVCHTQHCEHVPGRQFGKIRQKPLIYRLSLDTALIQADFVAG